jgi:hypothetical protein
MHKGTDSKIQAKVRILLARRWVDLRSVTIGTTNGVVYIGGELRTPGGSGLDVAEAAEAARSAWCRRIQREIESIPDVRDVVFRFGESCPGTPVQEAAS